jgi:hypothetical protein
MYCIIVHVPLYTYIADEDPGERGYCVPPQGKEVHSQRTWTGGSQGKRDSYYSPPSLSPSVN